MKECYICKKHACYEKRHYTHNENIINNPFEQIFLERNILKCTVCNSMFIENSPESHELNAFYEELHKQVAGNYKKSNFPELHSRYLNQVIYLKNFVNFQLINDVLEIGSNITSMLPAFSYFKKNVNFFYFDQVDSEVIANYGGTRLGAFADSNTIRKTVGKDSIDLVNMSHSLEHISPEVINDFIKSIYDILTIGGYFFAEVPYQIDDDNFYPPHTIYYSESGIISLMENNGFIVKNFFFNDKKNITYEEEDQNPIIENILGKSYREYRAKFELSNESKRLAELDLHMLNYNRLNSNPYQKMQFIRILCRK